MNKVIFLDFDGVLNSKTSINCRIGMGFRVSHLDMIHKMHIRHLNTLCEKLGGEVEIVISSTHRMGTPTFCLEDILVANGMGEYCKVVGKTDVLNGQGICRGKEIHKYLHENYTECQMCILDDDADMGTLNTYLVQTDGQLGLLDKHVEEAFKLMQSKTWRKDENKDFECE